MTSTTNNTGISILRTIDGYNWSVFVSDEPVAEGRGARSLTHAIEYAMPAAIREAGDAIDLYVRMGESALSGKTRRISVEQAQTVPAAKLADAMMAVIRHH